MSYFAKPYFLIYDEWFDDNLEKTKLDIKKQKLKTFSNLHDFFYDQSIYKIGASEKHMQLDIKVNKKNLLPMIISRRVKKNILQYPTKNFVYLKGFLNADLNLISQKN